MPRCSACCCRCRSCPATAATHRRCFRRPVRPLLPPRLLSPPTQPRRAVCDRPGQRRSFELDGALNCMVLVVLSPRIGVGSCLAGPLSYKMKYRTPPPSRRCVACRRSRQAVALPYHRVRQARGSAGPCRGAVRQNTLPRGDRRKAPNASTQTAGALPSYGRQKTAAGIQRPHERVERCQCLPLWVLDTPWVTLVRSHI
jgi:hypothetical protein